MFERFTESARLATVAAQDAARAMRHRYVGTEHLLIGLAERDGLASRALERLGVSDGWARGQVRERIGEGEDQVDVGYIPWTPRLKAACELALREALSLGHSYIGTEHLLLGLAREKDGVAGRLLREAMGLEPDADLRTPVRDVVLEMLRPAPVEDALARVVEAELEVAPADQAAAQRIDPENVVAVLYVLMRDHLPVGVLNQLVEELEDAEASTWRFTDALLEAKARGLVERLR